MNEFESAEVVKDGKDRQYHIGLGPRDISDKVIFVGDPQRAKRIANFFDTVRVSVQNREFITYTGFYKGIELTVLGTGIGCDNTEIAIIELCQLKFPLTIIRCGSCGALQPDIEIGDLVISSGALRLETTSTFFVEAGYPAVASHEVILALLKSASDWNFSHHLGITATASGFYGAQSRRIPGFPVKDETLLDRIKKQGVKNIEMESSTLFSLASLRGFRAGTICTVFASRPRNSFIASDKKDQNELKAIRATLGAFEILNKMDEQKKDAPFWLPEF